MIPVKIFTQGFLGVCRKSKTANWSIIKAPLEKISWERHTAMLRAIFLFLLAPHTCWADTEAPVVTAISFNQGTVDVTDSEQTVDIYLDTLEDGSGVVLASAFSKVPEMDVRFGSIRSCVSARALNRLRRPGC